ncbi:MAG TPA: hypothetical protein VNG51_14115 [Ktedonobacteraceae bacterium]|nr:hypothetical protein [Ktedonobacteraceae bacterium]
MGYRYRGPRGYRNRNPLRFLWLFFFLPMVLFHSGVAFGVLIVIAIALFVIFRAAATTSFFGTNVPPQQRQQTYQPYQPYQPYEQTYQPDSANQPYQPYQPYEQGYQPYQPPVANQQSAQQKSPAQYEAPQYEEQPQAQYPEELPPMAQ